MIRLTCLIVGDVLGGGARMSKSFDSDEWIEANLNDFIVRFIPAIRCDGTVKLNR
jgi:hypothetical protein